jgi:hypothetical protein
MTIASKWIALAGLSGLAMTSASTVLAQEKMPASSYLAEHVRAPRDALQLAVGAGYSQGTMSPAQGVGATDLTKAGGAFALHLGYRFSPAFSLNLYGEYDEFTPGNTVSDGATRGGVGGLNAMFHFLPFNRVDPWVRIGGGYRMLWVTGSTATPDTLWHGFQIAKLDIGVDLHTNEDIAIGPTIGIDVSHFFWQNQSGVGGDVEIVGKRFVPFVYAGLEGRFDIAGSRERRSGMPDPAPIGAHGPSSTNVASR